MAERPAICSYDVGDVPFSNRAEDACAFSVDQRIIASGAPDRFAEPPSRPPRSSLPVAFSPPPPLTSSAFTDVEEHGSEGERGQSE